MREIHKLRHNREADRSLIRKYIIQMYEYQLQSSQILQQNAIPMQKARRSRHEKSGENSGLNETNLA